MNSAQVGWPQNGFSAYSCTYWMLKYQLIGNEMMPKTHRTISSVDSCGPVGMRLKMAGFDLTMNTMTAMPRIACTKRATIAGVSRLN